MPPSVAVRLPDGAVKAYPAGTRFQDVLKDLPVKRLQTQTLAARYNSQVYDLCRSVEGNGALEFILPETEAGTEIIRHSSAHVLAMAVQKLWPGTQVTIGPVIEHGFYYDFAFPPGVKPSEADLVAIEGEMLKIVKADYKVTRKVVPRDEAIQIFKKLGEHFKVEIINDLPTGEAISIYEMGNWFDLCVGPHVPSTGKLGAFKLTAISGSYWRGDEKNPALTRIYGTAWATQKELQTHLFRLEEAKRRDHRVLGKQLNLFSFHKEATAHPFFHPKGQLVFSKLKSFMATSNAEYGFSEVGTPLVMDVDLWHKSGHYDNYRENMYFTKVDEHDAAIKPMNCPGHCLIYSAAQHSYRELPIRLSEFGRVHRHERSGVTHGLFRVRSFTQDDAHVFCMPEHIAAEVKRIIEQVDTTYKHMGFEQYRVELSTRPAKSIGSDEIWEKAERALRETLETIGMAYKLNPGDGAFYGPKIDFHLIDSIGRSWQCGTIQLDFSMPQRFGLEYKGSDDRMHTPVMIHRAVLGSIERFMGIMIEHHAGVLPLWLAPVQIRILNISEAQTDYAQAVYRQLHQAGVRVELDLRNEKLGYKIREAQLEKIPYMVILGDKEVQSGMVTARLRDGKNVGPERVDTLIQRVVSDCGGSVLEDRERGATT